MNEYVGIDIGGTKIEAVLVDERNTVLNTCRIPARPGAQNVLDDVIGITRRLGGEPVAVGVGLPGQVDSVTGVVRDIVNLDIVKLELGREASKALGIPVQVENDVNAAALGAVALIDDQVSAGDTVVFLNFGTGLAAGVVRDGHVERGYSGSYGEIGHIPVDPNKFLCNCGQRGCLETVTSGGSVAKLWPGQPPLPDLIEKTKAGEPRAMEVYGIVQHGLAVHLDCIVQHADVMYGLLAQLLIGKYLEIVKPLKLLLYAGYQRIAPFGLVEQPTYLHGFLFGERNAAQQVVEEG